MAQRRRRDIESALEKKGFRRSDTDHAWFVYFTDDGKKTTARTKTSHGASGTSIGSPLLGMMAKQCGLATGEFLDLVDCPLTRESYQVLIEQRGKL
jgi:hypothetical protein